MLFPGAGARDRGRGAPPPANPNIVTVTITPPSGPPMSGALVEQAGDFYVTFRQAGRHHPRRPHHRREGGHDRSASGAHRFTGPHHRQADSRCGGLPGEPEMKRFVIASVLLLSTVLQRTAAGTDQRADREAGRGFLADLQRRLFRTPLQHAREDQRREREAPERGVDLRPAAAAASSRRHRCS
mgnify:CR=1 FL=1